MQQVDQILSQVNDLGQILQKQKILTPNSPAR